MQPCLALLGYRHCWHTHQLPGAQHQNLTHRKREDAYVPSLPKSMHWRHLQSPEAVGRGMTHSSASHVSTNSVAEGEALHCFFCLHDDHVELGSVLSVGSPSKGGMSGQRPGEKIKGRNQNEAEGQVCWPGSSFQLPVPTNITPATQRPQPHLLSRRRRPSPDERSLLVSENPTTSIFTFVFKRS